MKTQLSILVTMVLAVSIFLTFFMVGCNKKEEANATVTAQQVVSSDSVFEKDSFIYKDIISSLPDGAAYAIVDMAEDQDALLVTDKAFSFEGKLEATEATVYAQDKDGKVVEMGKIESTTTSMPFMVHEHGVLFGSHRSMSKATINTKESKMEVETAKTNLDETDVANKAYNMLFEEYTEGTIVEFTSIK